MPEAMLVLLAQIDALLAESSAPDGPQTVLRIERTLTDGYASALALEGERLRLDREIAGVTAAIDGGDSARGAARLSHLARRRSAVDGELAHLRGRLDQLRRRARELRMPPPQMQAP